jgi:AcrR family transcriptional regulator
MPVDLALGASQRQWQREQTVLRIEQAALRVFVDMGYNASSADHIAQAAGVSVRTFFRYFPHGKEDVMVREARRQIDALADAVRARPATEPVVTTIIEAVHALYRHPSVATTEAADLYSEIAKSDAGLVARMIGERQIRADTLVPLLARRMAIDPAKDIRPRLLAHSLHTAMSVAWLAWLEGYAPETEQILDEILELMRPAFDAVQPSALPRPDAEESQG